MFALKTYALNMSVHTIVGASESFWLTTGGNPEGIYWKTLVYCFVISLLNFIFKSKFLCPSDIYLWTRFEKLLFVFLVKFKRHFQFRRQYFPLWFSVRGLTNQHGKHLSFLWISSMALKHYFVLFFLGPTVSLFICETLSEKKATSVYL